MTEKRRTVAWLKAKAEADEVAIRRQNSNAHFQVIVGLGWGAKWGILISCLWVPLGPIRDSIVALSGKETSIDLNFKVVASLTIASGLAMLVMRSKLKRQEQELVRQRGVIVKLEEDLNEFRARKATPE